MSTGFRETLIHPVGLMSRLIPGALASTCVAGTASLLAGTIPPVPLAVMIGAACKSLLSPFSFTKSLDPGLKFCSSTVLRSGVVCAGAKLSLLDLFSYGSLCLGPVLITVSSGMILIPMLARRMKLSSDLGTLIASGSSICGVTAIGATASVIKSDQEHVSVAVANVVAFGLTGMLVYPYLAHWMFAGDSNLSGMFLGLAIHDTSQVMGAAMTYKQVFADEAALKIAVVTKLTRNSLLALIIPILSILSSIEKRSQSHISFSEIRKHVPSFVLAFIFISLLRSVGDSSLESFGAAFGMISPPDWKAGVHLVSGIVSSSLLTVAMAGVGLGTDLRSLSSIGIKPFILGISGAFLVAGIGAASIGACDAVWRLTHN